MMVIVNWVLCKLDHTSKVNLPHLTLNRSRMQMTSVQWLYLSSCWQQLWN